MRNPFTTSPVVATLTAIFLLGMVPAIPILLFFRFDEGQLVFAGQVMGNQTLPGLFATLISICISLWLLLPVALAHLDAPAKRYWPSVLVAPMLLFGPSLLAGLFVGGRGFTAALGALLVMAVLTLIFTLWLVFMRQWMAMPMVLLLYGTFWVTSGFLDYIDRYILPSLDLPLLSVVPLLRWIMPQLGSAPGFLDEMIGGAGFQLRSWLPSLIQLPILTLLVIKLKGRRAEWRRAEWRRAEWRRAEGRRVDQGSDGSVSEHSDHRPTE